MAEIKFKRDTAFRKQLFVPNSFAHPAKMDAQLLIWIVLKYSEPGEVILDPMAGIGTLMLACGVGRNVILVELEGKFCKVMAGYDCDGEIKGYRDVWVELVEEGWLVYSGLECVEHLFKTWEEAKEFYETWEERGQPRDYGIRWQKGVSGHYVKEPIPADCGKKKNHKPHHVLGNWELVRMKPQLGCQMGACQIIQGDARDLEGLLADKIITSPPYTNRMDGGTELMRGFKPYSGEANGWYTTRPQDNLGNLPYGDIDKIITSLPFQEPDVRRKGMRKSREGYDYGSKLKMSSEHPDNISRLAETAYGNIDSIIASPPYEGSLDAHHGHSEADRPKEFAKLRAMGYKINPDSADNKVRGADYSDNPNNIGNLKSDTYLEAMLQVYKSCFAVLKDGGLMILVTKNFIRNRKVVRLDTDTIKLCEQAGFSYVERHWRKLPAQSFWRIIYHKKHPEVEQISFEDVLVFKK